MNGLHDQAFERDLLTIRPDYKIIISTKILNSKNSSLNSYFNQYHGKPINLPSRFFPDSSFLKLHNDERFQP
jgi:putative restriction endonuclease